MKVPEVASFGMELAQAKLDGRRLVGYASVFDYPIDTDSRSFPQKTYVRPGFFTRTLEKNRDMIQVLYHHGQDPQVGTVPLGRPEVMEQDKTGLWTETPLASTRFNEETLIPLLDSGALRAMSIQFVSEQESYNDDRSERYLEQGRLYEFGPTPFPANEAATASLHSLAGFLQIGVELHQGMMPMPGSDAEMRTHLASEHGQARSRTADMTTAEMRAMHERMHADGAGHTHEGMSSGAETEMHWDGAAAMRSASSASEFRQIAFERSNDSDPDTAAHWALPHHPRPGAPADPQGVAAALAALHGGRGGPPDLKDAGAAERHLQAHQGQSSSERDPSLEAARLRLSAHETFDERMEERWQRLGS